MTNTGDFDVPGDGQSTSADISVALRGVRVLEWGENLGASFAGKLLADLGADVITVEWPGADREASDRLVMGRNHGVEHRGMFHFLNANKRSVSVGPGEPSQSALFLQLLDASDVFLAGGSVGRLRVHGLTEEALRERFPHLIFTSITPFGFAGPLSEASAHDITLCAMGGITNMVGDPRRPPLTPPLALSSFQGGLAAAAGSLLALFARDQSGRGQHVDISPLDVWATVHQGSIFANDVYFGYTTSRGARRRPGPYPFELMRAKDGWMCLIARELEQWSRFIVDVVGDPRLTENERYRNQLAMGREYPDEVDEILRPWFAERTRDEIFALCRKHRVPFAPVRRIDEAAECEHLAARKFFVDVPTDGIGSFVRIPGLPFASPRRRRIKPSPALGQDTEEVRRELERESTTRRRLAVDGIEAAASARRPLDGVRVLDLSWVLAGPLTGKLLADAGAQVIKVESNSRLDNSRRMGSLPTQSTDTGLSSEPINRAPMFHLLNAGKLSVELDLRSAGGASAVRELVRVSDVVLENFAPGVLGRLGLDYPSLVPQRPELVMLSLSGFGQHGPLSDVPAYAPTVTSLGGLDSVVGYAGEEPMGTMGLNFADSVGGLFGFLGVLAALRVRRSSGQGQWLDYSEMEGVVSVIPQPFVDYFMTGRVAQPSGDGNDVWPCGAFETMVPGEWVSIAVASDEEWHAFCVATADEPWVGDSRFATNAGRVANREDLARQVSAYTSVRTAAQVTDVLRVAGVAVAPVYRVRDQVSDEHLWARGVFRRIAVPGVGDLTLCGSPWRLSQTPVQPDRGAPNLGEDTDRVLHELLGMSEAAIQRLRAGDARR